MKKTILSVLAIAALAFTLTSCGPSKAYTALEVALKTAITKAQAATTPEDFTAISESFKVTSDSIIKAYGDKMTASESTVIDSLTNQFVEISTAKAAEFQAAAQKAIDDAAAQAAAEEEAAKTAKK